MNAHVDSSTATARAGMSQLTSDVQRNQEAYGKIGEVLDIFRGSRIEIPPLVQQHRNQLYQRMNVILAILLAGSIITLLGGLLIR